MDKCVAPSLWPHLSAASSANPSLSDCRMSSSMAAEPGADIMKVFPAPSLGGPAFVKVSRGPGHGLA